MRKASGISQRPNADRTFPVQLDVNKPWIAVFCKYGFFQGAKLSALRPIAGVYVGEKVVEGFD